MGKGERALSALLLVSSERGGLGRLGLLTEVGRTATGPAVSYLGFQCRVRLVPHLKDGGKMVESWLTATVLDNMTDTNQ